MLACYGTHTDQSVLSSYWAMVSKSEDYLDSTMFNMYAVFVPENKACVTSKSSLVNSKGYFCLDTANMLLSLLFYNLLLVPHHQHADV